MNLANIADTAFNVAAGLGATETCVVHLGKTQTYDFDTDKNTPSAGSDVTLVGIFYAEEEDQGVELTAQMANFLIRGRDVPSQVREQDTLTRSKDSTVWQIWRVDYVPTDTVCTLRLRK
jgi:hypothetical protein